MLHSLWRAVMVVMNAWIFVVGMLAFLMANYQLMAASFIFNVICLTGMFRLWKVKDGE